MSGDNAPYRVPVSSDDGGPATVFEHLWTPYRMAYIRGEGKPTGAHDCPFCVIPTLDDEEGLVVARGASVFAVLNLYPYNAGHLMLVPYRHVPDYTDLTADEVAELGAFTQTAMRVVRSVTGAHGFNIGMNQGSVAGAGIADHLHQHAVPRWGGDTNFMPVIGLTRVLPQVLRETRALLATAWAEHVVPAGPASTHPSTAEPSARPATAEPSARPATAEPSARPATPTEA